MFLKYLLSLLQPQSNQVPEDERKKFEKEFEEYYQKLQTAKDEWVLMCINNKT